MFNFICKFIDVVINFKVQNREESIQHHKTGEKTKQKVYIPEPKTKQKPEPNSNTKTQKNKTADN
jgi:hypothetical protein